MNFWNSWTFSSTSMNFNQMFLTFFKFDEPVSNSMNLFPNWMNYFSNSFNFFQIRWTFFKIGELFFQNRWFFFKSMNFFKKWWTIYSTRWTFSKIWWTFFKFVFFKSQHVQQWIRQKFNGQCGQLSLTTDGQLIERASCFFRTEVIERRESDPAKWVGPSELDVSATRHKGRIRRQRGGLGRRKTTPMHSFRQWSRHVAQSVVWPSVARLML